MKFNHTIIWLYIAYCLLDQACIFVFNLHVLYQIHLDVIILLFVFIYNWCFPDFKKAFTVSPVSIWGMWTVYTIVNWFICPYSSFKESDHLHWYWTIFSISRTYIIMALVYYEASYDINKTLKNLIYIYILFALLGFGGQGSGPDKSDVASWAGRNGTLLGNFFPLCMICSLFVVFLSYIKKHINLKVVLVWSVVVFYACLWVATRKALGGAMILTFFFILSQMRNISIKSLSILAIGFYFFYFGYTMIIDNTVIGQRLLEMDDYEYDVDVPEWLYFLGDRAFQYVVAWEVFLDHPINGVGLYNSMDYTHLTIPIHSEYMEHLCEGGIIGFALFISFVISISNGIRKSMYSDSRFVSLICLGGFFMYLFVNLTSWVYDEASYFVLLALIVVSYKSVNQMNPVKM